jgi:hypothetical protein
MFELQPLFLQRNFFQILINGHKLPCGTDLYRLLLKFAPQQYLMM